MTAAERAPPSTGYDPVVQRVDPLNSFQFTGSFDFFGCNCDRLFNGWFNLGEVNDAPLANFILDWENLQHVFPARPLQTSQKAVCWAVTPTKEKRLWTAN